MRLRKPLALVFALLSSLPAFADEVEDFYRGRTLTVVVGHEVGTGFDVYARVLQKHLGRFMPGQPNVTVQNMQGASGMNAGNWLYNVAPRDGSVMATFAHTVTFDPIMGDGAAKFEASKFSWIGNLDETTPICGISPGSGISSFEGLRHKEVVFGGSGAAGPLSQTPNAVRNLLGAQIKLVHGYRGSFDLKLAIERGEVFGICGIGLSTARAEWRDLMETGKFKLIIQLGQKRHRDLPDLPLAYDYATSDFDRQVFDLIFGVQALGRSYAAPPGVPAARVAALRKALVEVVRDPAFLADAKAAQMELTPSSGEEVEKMIARFYRASPEAVARARQAVRGP